MRINKFVASASGISRRAADKAIEAGRVSINGKSASIGHELQPGDEVTFDGQTLETQPTITVMLNKPVGFVCSRQGQGSRTIYELLPAELQSLKPVGRLDKDSSGLILLTNDGDLVNQLTHPSFVKTKIYQIQLDKPLEPLHQQMINNPGITLEDGLSRLTLEKTDQNGLRWQVSMSEGRNRQIRRTFNALGYEVTKLHRVQVGNYKIGGIAASEWRQVE